MLFGHRPKAGPTVTTYSAEIFPSLRLNNATWDETSSTYAETSDTEAVYLTFGGSAFGRVVYAPNDPQVTTPQHTNGDQHVFLEIHSSTARVDVDRHRQGHERARRADDVPRVRRPRTSDYRPHDRWGDFREDYKFTGKEDDVEVGLTYFGARYYSPQLGRWISPDPLAIHGGGGDLNPYAYVHGRVTTATDPTGLDDGGFTFDGTWGSQPQTPQTQVPQVPQVILNSVTSSPGTPDGLMTWMVNTATAGYGAITTWGMVGLNVVSDGVASGLDFVSDGTLAVKDGIWGASAGLMASLDPGAAAGGTLATGAVGGVMAWTFGLGLMAGGALQLNAGGAGGASAVEETFALGRIGNAGLRSPRQPQLLGSPRMVPRRWGSGLGSS